MILILWKIIYINYEWNLDLQYLIKYIFIYKTNYNFRCEALTISKLLIMLFDNVVSDYDSRIETSKLLMMRQDFSSNALDVNWEKISYSSSLSGKVFNSIFFKLLHIKNRIIWYMHI